MEQTGPKGINWTEAFKFYCETVEGRLPSYDDVAVKFNVSKTEVGQRSLEENWTKHRQELYENGKNKFLENKVNLIAETEERELGRWKEIQNLADKLLKEIKAVPSISKLVSLTKIYKVAIEGERTLLGLPNNFLNTNLRLNKQDTPVKLSPELIQEIDRLFEINSPNPTFVNQS